MAQRVGRRAVAAMAVAMGAVAASAPALAVLPLVAGLGKQIIQNMLIDGVKSQLIGSLAQSGCKGAAIASMVAGSPTRTLGGMLGGGLGAGLPAGAAMRPNSPMPAMPSMGAMGAMPAMGDAASLRAARGGVGIANAAAPGVDSRTMDMSQLMAVAQQQAGGRMGAMPAMSPEQMAQMQSAMAQMQQAMAQPLSPAETQAVFDELAALGVMTPAMQTEARECIALAGPSAAPGLGASAALMKTMVLPKLREAHERMANLTPEEREQLSGEIAQAMKDASPEDRKTFQEGFGVGFFPPDVVESVRAKLP